MGINILVKFIDQQLKYNYNFSTRRQHLKKKIERTNLIVISDIHAGCRVALCPPKGVKLDDGGVYKPSKLQLKLWKMWDEFWTIWVPMVTKGEPYDVVINGDSIDGTHHGSTTQISQNIEDQIRVAIELLTPVAENCRNFYMVRGTEAHVGQSGTYEEQLAQRLGAIPNAEGQYARHELWLYVGESLVHLMHHIGSSGSAAYESTAVHKELIESLTEAARQNLEPPSVIVRSHRHRAFKTSFPSNRGEMISVVTPGWQCKTPFAYKIPGGRTSLPQFGGLLIRSGDEDAIYVRQKSWHIGRPEAE